MIVRFEDLLGQIKQMDREIAELKRNRARIPGSRTYSADLQVAFDKHINGLLNHRIALEELEIENPSEELIAEIVSVDMATASRITVDRTTQTVEPTAKERRLLEFLRKLPKTEIHLHMEACISRETLIKMMESNKQAIDEKKIEALYDFKNLQEFVQLFLFILDAIVSPKRFRVYLSESAVVP